MNKDSPVEPWDRLLLGASIASMQDDGTPYGIIEDGAIAWLGERLQYVGRRGDLPDQPERLARRVDHLPGGLITPGLIDCHTHLVFDGNRAEEFELRLQGVPYAEISRRGGGIVSTVAATRRASSERLLALSCQRLDEWMQDGVTTVEIKSGYGLDLATERRQLQVAREAGRRSGLRVSCTFLGAHALPLEYRSQRAAYLDLVCQQMLPSLAAEGLVDAVDAFCENVGFHPDEVRQVFTAARDLGLRVKLHADQLSDLGGAALAAEYRALSADHLEYCSPEGVQAMAEAGTVAVLLPGAFLVLNETRKPPIADMRSHGVAMALASDLNPGSSPHRSLRAAMHLGCCLFGLTPSEALRGVTVHAARALGLEQELGQLRAGLRADLVHWNVQHPAELSYWLGGHLTQEVIANGRSLFRRAGPGTVI